MGGSVKVLLVIASDRRRGAELEGVQLASELNSIGFTAEVVALASADASSGVDVSAARREAIWGSGHFMRCGGGRGSVDVVIAYGSSTLPACAISMFGLSTPFVYRSIGDPTAWVRSDWHRRRTGLLMRRACRVVALWPGAAEAICDTYGVTADRVDVIPNARSSSEFDVADEAMRHTARRSLGLSYEGLVVGCVGSISAEKRIELAVDAVAEVDDAVVLVVGDGPERAVVEELAAARLGDRAIFTGQLENVSDVYAAIDLLLLTSVTEGMPGVIIEAAMSGVPVVAPDVGAVRWLFENGVQGESVSTDAVAQEYSAAIARTAVTPRTGEAVVLQACAWGTVVEQWARILGLVSPLARPEVAA